MKRLTKRTVAGTANIDYEGCTFPNGEEDYIAKSARRQLAIDRLAAIEDILCDGTDDYDLDRLAVMCNQRMTMREEVSQRFSLTAKIPLDRLRELVEADRDGRCVVVPCKPGDTVWRIVNDATPHITKDKCLTIMLDNGSMWVDLIDNGMNGLYFGQRLFRTRAEAEAALKAREQDG